MHTSPINSGSVKLTALHDVTVRACVEGQPQWVELGAGQQCVVENLYGVHPEMAPESRAIHLRGATFVPAWCDALPAEPFGLVRVEAAA